MFFQDYFLVHLYKKLTTTKGVDILKVSRTISIEFDDLARIKKLISEGKASNLSEFIQKAVKHELKGVTNG